MCWISVNERLPTPEYDEQRRVRVLVAYDSGYVKEAVYEFHNWTSLGVGFQAQFREHITHWMELPKGPNGTSTNLYDIVEEHDNCHVQVLRNSITGEVSIGWYREETNQ